MTKWGGCKIDPLALLVQGLNFKELEMKPLTQTQIENMVKEFFDMPKNVDVNLLTNIVNHAESLGISLWQLVEAILIDYYARRTATRQVYGEGVPIPAPEFVKEILDDGQERAMGGQLLFSNLFEHYKKEIISQKENTAELERRCETLLAKLLKTHEGRAEYERDRAKLIVEYEKRKQDKS